jgi:hypothetical protein
MGIDIKLTDNLYWGSAHENEYEIAQFRAPVADASRSTQGYMDLFFLGLMQNGKMDSILMKTGSTHANASDPIDEKFRFDSLQEISQKLKELGCVKGSN